MDCSFTNIWSSRSRYFSQAKKIGAQIQKRLIYMSAGKKIHSFYVFELMIHFLAEESFLDIYSDDILRNITPGV